MLGGAGNAAVADGRDAYGFTGRRFDGETGLWYFRGRQFCSQNGRFLSRDTVGYMDGYNQYTAYFSPNHKDPSGMTVDGCDGNPTESSAGVDMAPDPDYDMPIKYKSESPIPPSKFDKPGKVIYGQVTVDSVKVDCQCCDCGECEEPKKYWIFCQITARFSVSIDPKVLAKPNTPSLREVYGHEMQHLKSWKVELTKLRNKMHKGLASIGCSLDKWTCENVRAPGKESGYETDITKTMKKEHDHTNPGSPPEDGPGDPYTGPIPKPTNDQ